MIAATLDALVARNSAFRDMADLLSQPHYRPSLDMREAWARQVADAYDQAQAARGDDRRAYRYAIEEGAAIVAAEAERIAIEAERIAAEQRKAQRAAETVADRDVGHVLANQGKRRARVLGLAEGRALVEYDMPAGRSFLWDVPASTAWRDLVDNPAAAGIRNVSANRPPQRWRELLAQAVAA